MKSSKLVHIGGMLLIETDSKYRTVFGREELILGRDDHSLLEHTTPDQFREVLIQLLALELAKHTQIPKEDLGLLSEQDLKRAHYESEDLAFSLDPDSYCD